MLEADVANLREASNIKTELLNFQQTKIVELTAELEAFQAMMLMSNGGSALQACMHGQLFISAFPRRLLLKLL